MIEIPATGSVWQHRSGRRYTVLLIANSADTQRYPRTVVYRDADGWVWARPLADWHRSMTLADAA